MKVLIKLLSIAICLSSCESITPTPKMFSCRVNGKLWEPYIKGTFGGRFTGKATKYKKSGTLIIFGNSEDCSIGLAIKFEPNGEIELSKKYKIEKEFLLNQATADFSSNSSLNNSQKILVKAVSGNIVITKMDAQYFSGTFEYDLEKEIESKKYKIRKGQFNNMLYAKDDN